jgi:protein CpxP
MLSLGITKSKQTEMKKVLLVCAFILGISAVSFAQGGGRMRMSPKMQIDSIKAHVSGITDEQTAKLLAVYEDAGKKRDSIRQAANGDRQAMMSAMMKMQPMTDAKVKAILTADQAAAYQKMVDKRAAQMRARMQGN